MLALFVALLAPKSDIRFEPIPPAAYGGLYPGNAEPLAPSPFRKLPIGSIKPEGWLRKQLVMEADGFTGHLDELSGFLNPENNAWLSPTGEGRNGWEEVPYWLRGFGDLGYVLRDPRITAEATKWVKAIMGSQQPDGYFGPKRNRTGTRGKPDIWPNMLALNALQSYYESTGDKHVLDCMLAYFKWEYAIPDADLLTDYWEHQRQGDNIASVLWLYNRVHAGFLLNLAEKLHGRGAKWDAGVANWHGVNFAQGFREPAEIAEVTKDAKQTAMTEADYETARRLYGQVPGGMWGADENARQGYSDPRQAAETCTMVEMMWSDEFLLTMSGDPKWADRCEDVAFNSLPASMTSDEKALHYLTSPNMVRIDANSHAPDVENGGPMLLYNPYDHRCCQHNSGMGWPYFAEHLWLATPDGGLTAAMYAPNTVHAKVGNGMPVTIREETHYPFSETIVFHVDPAKPTRFKLRLRIPAWCTGAGSGLMPTISINGQTKPAMFYAESDYISYPPPQAYYVVVDETWRRGDGLTLKLPMKTEVTNWPTQHDSVSITRGPLAYSLKIGEKFERGPGGSDKWPTWTVSPTTDWDFGLLPSAKITVKERAWPKDDQPFTPASAPIELVATGRKVDQWQADYLGTVGLLQASPAKTAEPIEQLRLIPMGAARLRITVFPTVTKDGSGHEWKPQPGHKPLPTKASFVGFFDVISAPSDGIEPKSSDDETIPRFTWWDHKGTKEWIEYDLSKPTLHSKASVYWFDDTGHGGCRVPVSWRLVYEENQAWKRVEGAIYGVERDKYNSVEFTPVTAAKWRIEAQLQSGFSAGILEWKLE
ncbi:MAG TPA: beta-L-arabinofuranosidase domain-containing protein [Fimbriimonadaceae bacterium]|nr:beta-L-arabinofuranosidase domain-containing protein [Fimbriimonadaceae bacterium]